MEEEEEIEQHVPYASRPDWAGVSPIPIPETEANAPVTIAYAPDYAEAMAYFRAICAANEKSERGLELTGTILAWNPAHYTVWKLRQDTLWALSKNLWDELDFVDQMAAENPKSYQIW
jgi:protein farnesyltransferase/geranylgeranyltransferase type-1 subunit alpha